MPLSIVCEVCEETFEISPSRMGTARFCSIECKAESQKQIKGPDHPCYQQMTMLCETCGKPFSIPPSRANSARFCSIRCKNQTQTIVCPICGKKRTIKKSWVGRVFTCGSKTCNSVYRWNQFRKKFQRKHGETFKAVLHRLYHIERCSYREIAAMYDISHQAIKKGLHKFGIKIRYGGEAVATQWENNDERRKATAERFREFARNNKGPKNYLWQGGTSYEYGIPRSDWRKIAAQARKRDGNICTRCGITNKGSRTVYNKPLDVHHIIPYQLSNDNSLQNLRALCTSCHRIVETEFIWLL